MSKNEHLFIFSICLAFFTFALLGAGAINLDSERYVSEFTYIPGTQFENFAHGLGTRPLDVHAWIAIDPPKPLHALPYTDYGKISITVVNDTIIRVVNMNATGIYVQVIAER